MDTEITRRVAAAGLVAIALLLRTPRLHLLRALGALAFLGLCLGRSLMAPSPWYGLFETLLIGLVAGTWLLVREEPLTETDLSIGLTGLGLLLILLVRFQASNWQPLPDSPLKVSGLNPNTLAHLWALASVACLNSFATSAKHRWLWLAPLALFLLHLLPQDTKAAWIAFTLGSLFILWRVLPWKLAKAAVLLAGLAGAALVIQKAKTPQPGQESESIRERTWMAASAELSIRQTFFQGQGPGQFPATSLALLPKLAEENPNARPPRSNVALNPHSELLTIAHDWGVPALMALLFFLWPHWLAQKDRWPLLAAFAVIAIFDFPLHVTPLALLAVLLTFSYVKTTSPTPKNWLPALAVLPLALFLGALALGIGRAEWLLQNGLRTKNFQDLEAASILSIRHPYAAGEAGKWLLLVGGEDLVPNDKARLDLAYRELQAAQQGRATARNRNNLGVALRRLKRPKEALQLFREAVLMEPYYCDAWFNLAMALRESGNKDPDLEEDALRRSRLCGQYQMGLFPRHSEALSLRP